jgi:hypothetical protein
MQILPPRYLATQGRHPIIEALTPEINTWFGNSVTEPIPDELAAILRRMDSCTGGTRATAKKTAT